MVNVFGVGGDSVDLQIMKKVVVTKGRYKDYVNEIRQCYELGFTPYGLHTNKDGTFVTPIRVYDWRVYELDDVTTLQITARNIATGDNSKLIYFFEADDGSGVALQGDRGPSRVKGLKGDSGGKGPKARSSWNAWRCMVWRSSWKGW